MINKNKLLNFGSLCFSLGLLSLASLPFFSVIFFISSLVISFRFKFRNFLSDKNNIIFLIATIIMLFNAVIIHYFLNSNKLIGWDNKLSIIGLFNWIPFFLCFNGFQIYLEKVEQRIKSSKLLLIGSLPILFTGLGQYFLGWDHTINFLNGAIIWFIKPIESLSGLSGLFNNPNYTSAWLSIIWPFCLIFTIKNEKKFFNKIGRLVFLIFFLITLLLTNSRNGWFSIIIPFPMLFGISFLKISIFLVLIFISVVVSSYFNLIPLFLEEFLINLIPEKISNLIYFNFNNYDLYPRLDIWRVALNSIFMKPLFGWGAASFPFIYSAFKNINDNYVVYHSHNLFFELSINYGLIVSLLIFFNIMIILITSFGIIFYGKFIKKAKSYKAWFIASLIALFTQTFDVTYYDIRISLLFWILFSGLNSINKESLSQPYIESK